jgi:ATP-dependent DNA helicase RecG
VRLNSQITIAELSQLTGVTTRSVERNIDALKKIKRLQRIGSDKDGYWEVIID